MKKILIIPLVVVSLVAGYFVAVYEPSAKAALIEGNENHQECQYPSRPYVNGNCDNSDPAIVETNPVEEPVTTPEPTPTPVKNKCLQ